jgi:uncharacterized protein (DUF2141 family)
MHKTISNFIFIIIICFLLANCANRGTPGGGDKDITPPNITRSIPDNFSANFTGNEIKIYFDEYIKIKDLQKQLIISPPMDPAPEVTPLGSASKYITIKIYDTLATNTTYAFNFGNSIVDNNEENPFSYFRYVFSTGDYIDSLTVKGHVIDALKRNPDNFISVALYEVDSMFTDSIIYKENPKYVTNTLDSLTTFTIENIKAGKYMLLALKDKNQDNKFQQKTDKIGFHKSYISVPSDSVFSLKLFNEAIDFKATRPKMVAGEKIDFGYEGDYKNMNIDILSNTPEDFESKIIKDKLTDSLNYFYKPKLEVDSLLFKVTNTDYDEDFTVRIRDQERDSLLMEASPTGNILLAEDFLVSANIPFSNFAERNISILDKDSTQVSFTASLDTIQNTYKIIFAKTEENQYKIQMLPETFTDFFGNTNDTLNYSLRTKKASDYSNVRVILKNAIYPVIVQLTDEKGEVKYERFAEKSQFFDFNNLTPGKYYIRVVFDANGNKKYDTGNYLKKLQPESISHFPELLDARANWDEIIEFELISK